MNARSNYRQLMEKNQVNWAPIGFTHECCWASWLSELSAISVPANWYIRCSIGLLSSDMSLWAQLRSTNGIEEHSTLVTGSMLRVLINITEVEHLPSTIYCTSDLNLVWSRTAVHRILGFWGYPTSSNTFPVSAISRFFFVFSAIIFAMTMYHRHILSLRRMQVRVKHFQEDSSMKPSAEHFALCRTPSNHNFRSPERYLLGFPINRHCLTSYIIMPVTVSYWYHSVSMAKLKM